MTRKLPVQVEPHNLAQILWPEPFYAFENTHSHALDQGVNPDTATRHIRIATQAAKEEAYLLLQRLDAAGLEIRHKRIRP